MRPRHRVYGCNSLSRWKTDRKCVSCVSGIIVYDCTDTSTNKSHGSLHDYLTHIVISNPQLNKKEKKEAKSVCELLQFWWVSIYRFAKKRDIYLFFCYYLRRFMRSTSKLIWLFILNTSQPSEIWRIILNKNIVEY